MDNNMKSMHIKLRIHVVWFIIVLLAVAFFINVYSDNKKEDTIIEKEDSVSVQWRQNHFLLSEENLYNELVAQGVDFPEIVTAQAILETGHFKSYACLQQNNLFGLRDSKGTYMSFPHWTDAVAAYKKYIQRYNHPVPEDYYAYLQELGYAEDPQYIDKLKQIVNK
jgi:hypothetical protein